MTRHRLGIVSRLACLVSIVLLFHDRLLPNTLAFAPSARSLIPRHTHAVIRQKQSPTRLHGVISYTLAHIPHVNQRSSTAIAGKLMPLLKKFRVGAHEVKEIGAAIYSVTDWQDVVLLAFLAFCTPAFAKYRNDLSQHDGLRRFGITRLVSDISKVGLTVYAVDIVMVILTTLGFEFPSTWKVSAVFTRIAYSAWALREGLSLKRELICQFYKVKRNKMGRLEILDRFMNGIAAFVYGLFLLDWLSLELGYALKSIFGLASVFSVAFTLASKDILSNLLSGIWLQASGKAAPGDAVKFGDGTSGGLVKLGWLETSMRDGEGAIVKIPNAHLAGQKMSNLSEVKKSQVKQTLRFDYADADKIPELIHEIKEEIMKTCKKLVVDGSRPFRVHFTNYMEDHLEVTVVTHHNISPVSGEYHDNRQDLLLAINRAVKRCGMQFAQMVKVEIPGRETSWRVVPAKAYLEGGDGPNGEVSS